MQDNPGSVAPGEARRLAAIMFTDIVGFSRQMGADEARMLRILAVHNQLLQQAVAAHHGHVIKTMGDGFLVDFPSVVNAVQCAQHVQAQFCSYNTDKEAAAQIHVRIGIHLGDIIQQDGDVLGDGVNVASRLQTLAEPDTICISQVVYREVEKKLALGTVVALGRPKLKNIAERFHVYALLPESPRGWRQALQRHRLKLSRRIGTAHLARIALIVVGLLIGAGVVILLYPSLIRNPQSTIRNQEVLPLSNKPSIIVLPFDNMSKDPEQDYFSNGITDVLTSDLSRISSLFVIARNTAFTYKGKATNVQAIGKELGVRYVLEGSVQKAGEQMRIVAQLIDTGTDTHVWSERFDRPFKDIFALQDEIVQKIVTTLKLQLTAQEQGYIMRKHTDNLEAYDLLLRGIEPFFRSMPESVAQARQLWEQAVALVPQYAEAYAYLSWCYYREWGFRWSADPQGSLERALVLAQQAVAVDDSLPLAHSLLGNIYAAKQQYDQAIAEGERATALDPNNADSYYMRAEMLNSAGRPEEALRSIEQAIRLNPHFQPLYLYELGWAYQMTGRYTEAIATLQDFLSRMPNHPIGRIRLAFSYIFQWYYQQSPAAQTLEPALAEAQRLLVLNDSSLGGHLALGYAYLWQKQYEPARAELERVIVLDPNLADGYVGLAFLLSCMGKPEEAVRMVEQALRRKPVIEALEGIGVAYALAGRPEEAIAPLQQYLSHYPNILGPHLFLAAVYSELGREAEARAEAAEVLRINPQFSLEVHRQRQPIKDPALLERHLAVLRKAGLK
jgi:TolB-like protein/class 3 adenylate cyclase/Tfp pilus assembly protein PilF